MAFVTGSTFSMRPDSQAARSTRSCAAWSADKLSCRHSGKRQSSRTRSNDRLGATTSSRRLARWFSKRPLSVIACREQLRLACDGSVRRGPHDVPPGIVARPAPGRRRRLPRADARPATIGRASGMPSCGIEVARLRRTHNPPWRTEHGFASPRRSARFPTPRGSGTKSHAGSTPTPFTTSDMPCGSCSRHPASP